MTCRCFQKTEIAEREMLERFFYTIENRNEKGNKRVRVNAPNRAQDLPRPGEQVAAKVLRSHEDGSWILANVLDYDVNTHTFEVQDEDDVNRVATLPVCDVRRLEDTVIHFRKHDKVLGQFLFSFFSLFSFLF